MNQKPSSYVNPAYIHDDGATPELRRPSNCQGSRAKNLSFREKIMQQKLEAWKPVYEPISLIVFLFVISVIFVILGFIMMREIKRILDIEKPLTCDVLTNSEFETSMLQCRLNVTEDISGNVLFMYRIKNFYQNHRMYQSTLYNNELARSEQCNGKSYYNNERNFLVEIAEYYIPVLPHIDKICNKGEYFMYQDVFQVLDANGNAVPLTHEGITQDQDRVYFKNPIALKNNRDWATWEKYFINCHLVNSSCWKTPIYKLDTKDPSNNGLQNADYLVWRKRAAFPTFIKTYRKLKKTGAYKHGLPAGMYTVTGQLMTNFTGDPEIERQFFITVTSWLGIRNMWFAKLYVAVGFAGLLAAALLIIAHIKYGKTLDQKCNHSMPIVFHG